MQKLTIEDMHRIAIDRGGKCLSDTYINRSTKLKWQCKEGHTWEARPTDIKGGTWCPVCAGNTVSSIEEMQAIAEAKKGKCLSQKYINTNTKLIWQCHEGHIWEAMPDKIKQGTWCPICSTGVSERICRKYFEEIFKDEFPKKRPKWLKSDINTQLELDGYCEKLGIAFEYHGIQHFTQNDFFHRHSNFAQRNKYDELRRLLCAENSVILIEIPYTVDYEDMGNFIIQQCKDRGIKIPEQSADLNYRLFDIYSSEEFNRVKEIAESKGGKCLSPNYLNSQTKLKWQCKEGHIWDTVPNSIKNGTWCPICAGNTMSNIDEMCKIAAVKNGKCLSQTYLGAHVKLKWQCEKAHTWEASPANVKSGKWCPYCAGLAGLTILEMQNIAISRGGKCLSEVYVNNNTKIKWQCKEGHTWEANPACVKSGTWCPYCGGSMRSNIEEMYNIAISRGGRCLSNAYVNNKTKLTWQCKEGHIWEAIPDTVKRGSWCSICYDSKRSKSQRLGIEEMNVIAESKGGRCLSKGYTNSRTSIKWQCREGHIWEARPGNIKSGTWCPVCAYRKISGIL